MHRHILVSVLACCAFLPAAHADDFKLFNVTGTFQDGATLSGTLNLDLDDAFGGAFPFHSVADFSVIASGTTYVFQKTNVGIGGSSSSTLLDFENTQGAQVELTFSTPVPGALAGFNGSALTAATVFSTPHYAVALQSGALTAVTPEPSSLALLGTGALALIAAARRRFA